MPCDDKAGDGVESRIYIAEASNIGYMLRQPWNYREFRDGHSVGEGQ